MKNGTYAETIEYLYAQLPMFSRVGAAALKLDLDNTFALLEACGNPHLQFKSIHIAGTNGKGSSSHMLAAICQEAGYKTGLYTSPHLVDFRERIKVNGFMCEEEFVIKFTEMMKPTIDNIKPSFFELTVAMAFRYFADQRVDVAVVETGMGGRLDSTNVLSPLVSLITNISYDHMQMLGDTLPAIAAEKAGIIKQDTPVVISETQVEVMQVFKAKAMQVSAPIYFADQLYKVIAAHLEPTSLELFIKHLPTNSTNAYTLDINSNYQRKNVLGVLATVEVLNDVGLNIPAEALHKALSNVKQLTGLHGRWEVIAERPLTVLDVGHNEAGIIEINQQLSLQKYQRLHIVLGFVKDKDISKVLQLLPVEATYYFTQAALPRALEHDTLREMAKAAGLHGNAYATVKAAFAAAKQAAGPEDLLLVCGSFFIVAEVL